MGIAFTKKRPDQIKKTCYAQTAQIRAIRKKMTTIMAAEASKCDLKDLYLKLIPGVIGKEIEKATQGIFPLQNVLVRKVKLMELHADSKANAAGNKVEREEDQLVETMAG